MLVFWLNTVSHDPFGNFLKVTILHSVNMANFPPNSLVTKVWLNIYHSQSSSLFHICPHGHVLFMTMFCEIYKPVLRFSLCHHMGWLALGCYTVLKGFCPVVVQSEQCQKRRAFLFFSAKKWTVMCLFKQPGQWSSKFNAAISILNLIVWMYIRPFR